jgi:hypothetical protein
MEAFQIDSDIRDGADFDLVKTLIDAQDRGSKLASEMLQAIRDYDSKDAQHFHDEMESSLEQARESISSLFEGFGKSPDDELEEDEEAEYSEFLNETANDIFDCNQKNLKLETLSLILGEYYKSTQESGAFGDSEHLLYFDYFWKFSNWGLGITPFFSRTLLWEVSVGEKQLWSGMEGSCACGCTWGKDSTDSLRSIVFSPIVSGSLLTEIIRYQIETYNDFRWIGLSLLLNPNLTLDNLVSLAESDRVSDFANSYCLRGRNEDGKGVCGGLLDIGMQYPISNTGAPLFGNEECFSSWGEEDIIGTLDEDDSDNGLIQLLISIATMYLSTDKGANESTRETLNRSETFGKILLAFRIAEEFKSGRAVIDEGLNSESLLVRTLLYWKPGLEESKRLTLKERGIDDFDDQIGSVISHAWSSVPHLLV